MAKNNITCRCWFSQGNFVPKQYSITIGASIFGFLVIVSGLLSIALPETTGHNMPETVEEANIYPRLV
mgnify:CR=1 FL=1